MIRIVHLVSQMNLRAIQHIRGNGTLESPLPFSPAVRAGGFVFVSGMASADEDGKIVHDTFEN